MPTRTRPASREIDAYIDAAPVAAQPLLRTIRKLALAAAPGTEERFSYRMPTVFANGRVLLHYGAFRNHVGIFPPPKGDAAFMKAIAPYANPKGNLVIPFGAKVSQALLRAILRARLSETGSAPAAPKATANGAPARGAKPVDGKTAAPRRPRWPMPAFVKRALEEAGLVDAYRGRPPYQRNDYVGWITQAKTPATQAKRLAQMLDELKRGGVYMRMKHAASAKARA